MAKVDIKFNTVMKMKEDEFVALAKKLGKVAELEEISARFTEQKKYPKIKKPSAKIPGKFTYQADKTAKPEIVVKPITFFEVKAAFAHEVMKIKPVEKAKMETFRDRIAQMAQNA